MTRSDNSPDLENRIIALEEAMMHNERLVSKLNEVMCQVQDRLDEQARQLAKLKEVFEQLKHQEPEERSFEDEQPPHY